MIRKTCEEDPATNTLSGASRSRDAQLGYYIHASSDVPPGFNISIPQSEWCRAIYIPGSTGLSASERYPARIYILTRELLSVVSHSDWHEFPFTIKISDLVELYSHKKQGLGELVFTAVKISPGFCYSPNQRQCIDNFLSALRSVWLRPAGIRPGEIAWPPQLSPWHRFVLESELDPGEPLVAMLTQSQFERSKAWFLRSSSGYLETSFLSLTDRRLIWFKFTEKPGSCPSSVTIQYVPRACVIDFSTRAGSSQSEFIELEIHLKSSQRWTLSLKAGHAAPLEALLKELPCSLADRYPQTE